MRENNFPQIWVPSPENRDLRQLLWHRHRLVPMRTRIMNQLQALAMNEGYRWKKKLFSEQGRAQLEKLTLPPWASRRRQKLLELLDRMNPTIEELTAAVEREVRKRPESVGLIASVDMFFDAFAISLLSYRQRSSRQGFGSSPVS
jgi:transposase